MAGELTSKVRLVRCPGCGGILQEVAPLYQCAGCGTVLQAKNRKNDTTGARLHMHETVPAQKHELEHVSDEHIAQSLRREQKCPSTGELLLEKNFGSDRSEIRDSYEEKSRNTQFSSELSTKLTGYIIEESSPPVRAETGFYHGECSSEQNNEGDQNEYGDYNAKKPEGVCFSNEVASTEINHHDCEELSSPDCSKEDFKQYNERTQNEYGYCNGKQLGGANFSDGDDSSYELNHHESVESSPLAGVYSEVDDSRNCSEQKYGRNQTEFVDHEREGPGSTKFSDESSLSTELTCQEVEDSSPVARTSSELDENFKSHFIIGRLSEENLQDSTISALRPSSESISMDNQMSPHIEQLEQSQERALSCFDRVSSKDTLEDFALSKHSPEFSPQFKDLPKDSTSRSYSAYYSAYDGSVFSYDGTDDRLYQPQNLLEENFKKAECASAEAMPVKDVVELQYEALKCSSISSQHKHYAMEGRKCWEDELVESTRSGHPVRSRMKFETDDPFYSTGHHIGSEYKSPPNYGRHFFQSSSSFDLPSKPQCPEEERMKLLKMVYELQDELNRTHMLKSRAKGIFPGVTGTEKQIPSYYGHVASAVGIYHDINNSRSTGSYNQGRNWTHQRQTSQIPLSAEPTIGRHQVDCSCFHGYHQDCNCSAAPLPPQIYRDNSQYTALPWQRYQSIYPSTSSSPQHYTRSEFSLRSHDVKHWHEDHHEDKIFSRERHQPMKKHLLPVAGGPPFLICYRCSALLQLPADFLVYGRRCHRLRCSACSVILKFGLQNGSHILPYTEIYPDSMPPPPSGRKLASVSFAGYSPNVESVSCSDDCGPSLRESCSTEEEPFPTALPLSAHNRESNDSKMSSGSSLEPMEERKKQTILKEPQNNCESPAKLHASAGSPLRRSIANKLSSEFEGFPPKSGSPLHKLLGYASPSQVLRSW